MPEIPLYKRFFQSPAGQLAAVLALFAVCRVVSISVFFEGFLHTFANITRHFFSPEKTPSLLAHVPYHSWSILLSALLHPFFLLTLLVLYLPLLKNRKFFREKFEFKRRDRILIFSAAILLAWELSTYDYNYYLDHAFYFDRILLVVLAVLLLRFPLLTPLFIAFAFVYRSQFNFPVAGFPLFDKRVLFDILILFVIFLYAQLLFPAFKFSFMFLVLCIIASNYFMTGAEKIFMSPHGIEWVTQNDPSDLFFNVRLRGWGVHWSHDTVQSVWNFLSRHGKMMQAFVLLIELSGLLLLRKRKLAIVLLCFFFLMHLGIFICGSMLFWKWMAMDLVLAGILIFRKENWDELFSMQNFRLSLGAILLSAIWLHPFRIGWFDTHMNQYFTYEVLDENGNAYGIGKNDLDPYHQWFQYDQFLFLVDKPLLPVSGFGYTDNFRAMRKINSLPQDSIAALEMERGKNYFDPKQKIAFENFIQTYFANRNKRLGKTFIPSLLHAPHHLYNSTTELQAYDGKTPVKEFRVTFHKVYSESGRVEWSQDTIVDKIVIPAN